MDVDYTNEELKLVKKAELKILKHVIECCTTLNIPYFLVYGTALGAVRHGGFIPWDDDIDIGLIRKNYERFIAEAPKWFNKTEMFVEHLTTEKTCPYTFAKVRLNNTVFSEYATRNIKCHQGVFVDVFPFDEVPASIEKQKKQYYKVQKLSRRYAYRQIPDISEKPNNLKLHIKSIFRKLIFVVYHAKSPEKIYHELTREMKKYNGCNSGIYGCLLYPKFQAGCMTKEMVTNLKTIQFENLQASIPENVEEYLYSQYGDYMKLPPVEERVGHKPYEIKL